MMSIIFGVHNYNQALVDERELGRLGCSTELYASDKACLRVEKDVGMGFQPYHTHQRSNLESQPLVEPGGSMLVWDGRLDNFQELIKQLNLPDAEVPDSQIVLAAFGRWGEECFARFVGDWALALWSRQDRSVYLARDHAGTRTLYFEQTGDRVLWSTYLETFFADGKTRELSREYAACYLTGSPLKDRTPYKDIYAVPPAHYLRIRSDGIVRPAHWQWMIQDRIRYSSVGTYGDHFFELFGRSVARRTGPGAPILAELSGGMDSSSIVCMSDTLRLPHRGGSSGEFLDTKSLFDDSEPAWDEKSYFAIVERQRGKTGTHIDVSRCDKSYEPLALSQGRLPLLPGLDSGTLRFQEDMESQLGYDHRILLSGIGGDELLGGVPSGAPELADLLVTGELGSLLRSAVAWCLVDRSPLIAMLFRTVQFAVRLHRHASRSTEHLPDWIPAQVGQLAANTGFPNPHLTQRIGMSPSTIDNGLTWWAILESQPHLFPSYSIRREYRYPYLDRELVEFLFRVPRHILLNPGRRRAMMRGALKNIVPVEILERRRKAYVIRKHLSSLAAQQEKLQDLLLKPRLADYGLVAPARLVSALRAVVGGHQVHMWPPVTRSISFELWLRSRPSVLN
jgi:asparagine synthase (glutamine-hydrolysing)